MSHLHHVARCGHVQAARRQVSRQQHAAVAAPKARHHVGAAVQPAAFVQHAYHQRAPLAVAFPAGLNILLLVFSVAALVLF
jgi:hypothetical protein